ncbi:MAG TPA: hypothetical protein PLC80_00965 [Draconibacterium sp.]|nr:hypothetical protein [Draconibacterium sp.]
MHYIIIIIIIVLIVSFQIKIFLETRDKLLIFKNIFASKSDNYNLKKTAIIAAIHKGNWSEHKSMLNTLGIDISKYEYTSVNAEGNSQVYYHRNQVISFLTKEAEENEIGIESKHSNPIYLRIQNSINNYLSVNKSGVSDYHLLKDIVDRNCDSQEEEITTQIPIPLYLGLVGTMVGILVGIGYLWVNGGLEALLSTPIQGNLSNEAFNALKDTLNNKSVNGITALLGGVALAMFASIFGILLTTVGSMNAKNAKSEVEKNKLIFLSWIQAKLLPTLSNDTAQTLERMSKNLVAFNYTFSSNTNELGKVLSQVNDSYRLQKQLLDSVKEIAEKDISVKNLQLYNVLKNSTEEIGTLAVYLNNVNDYLTNVKALNEKLDKSEQRTKSIEEMAAFFKAEVQQVEARKGAINKAVGTVDSVLQDALSKLKDHANEQLEELRKTIGRQHDFLQKNSEHINSIVSELKNLGAVKESIIKFEQATRAQSSKLDDLVDAVHALAKAKVEGTAIPISIEPKMPLKKKILIGVSSVFGVLVLLLLVGANWESINKLVYVVMSLFRI